MLNPIIGNSCPLVGQHQSHKLNPSKYVSQAINAFLNALPFKYELELVQLPRSAELK